MGLNQFHLHCFAYAIFKVVFRIRVFFLGSQITYFKLQLTFQPLINRAGFLSLRCFSLHKYVACKTTQENNSAQLLPNFKLSLRSKAARGMAMGDPFFQGKVQKRDCHISITGWPWRRTRPRGRPVIPHIFWKRPTAAECRIHIGTKAFQSGSDCSFIPGPKALWRFS